MTATDKALRANTRPENDMSINPHIDLWRSETYESPSEQRWFAFCAEVEGLLAIENLDGDQDADGFSIDTAFDYFESGETAADYAAFVREERGE